MVSFRALPLRRKITLLMMLTCAFALVSAALAISAREISTFRKELVRQQRALAGILGNSSVGALEFGDETLAAQLLQSLRPERDVVAAALYTRDGTLLAQFVRPGEAFEVPGRAPAHGETFEGTQLALSLPIQFKDAVVGTIYVRTDTGRLVIRINDLLVTIAVVLAVTLLLAFFVSYGLQRLVTRPIMGLVEIIRRVSRDKDYSIRAVAQSQDELGVLIDGFNEMLERIQERDEERAQTQAELARQAESLARSNAELEDFAYVASHDLKEPLRGIHNYSQFLLEDYAEQLDADGKEKLVALTRLTQRMESLIDSLLHYSRLGRTEGARRPTDLDAVLREVLETLQSSIDERGVEVRVPRPLPRLVCDRARLGEVFQNLIGNAIKYNDKPDPWVEIGWREPPEGDSHWTFYVRDNGIGIRDKHLELVFRIFKRLHGRDKFGGGTGAGLTIAKKIVEGHGGRIWVESSYGEGSAFYFTLEEASA